MRDADLVGAPWGGVARVGDDADDGVRGPQLLMQALLPDIPRPDSSTEVPGQESSVTEVGQRAVDLVGQLRVGVGVADKDARHIYPQFGRTLSGET